MNKDSVTHFIRSRLFAGILAGIGIVLIALCIFDIGVVVGYHEAMFASRWGENYNRNFGGGTFGQFGFDDNRPDAHGTAGQIVSVSSTTLVISGSQRPEQKVTLSNDTIIRNKEQTISSSQLMTGEHVVVIGIPDDQGVIDAKLIRVMPAAPGMPIISSSTQPL